MKLSVKQSLFSVSILLFIATLSLSGCRVTGGSTGSSNKSVKFEKNILLSAAADVPLVLGTQSPAVRFRVDVSSVFGDYKKKNHAWSQNFSIVSRDKYNNARLKVSIYEADGFSLLTERNTIAYYSASTNGSSYFFKTKGLNDELYSEDSSRIKLPVICSSDKKSCSISYIIDIELINNQSGTNSSLPAIMAKDGVFFESKVQVDAHKDCFTFLACVDGKNVKSVRPSIKITRVKQAE